MTRSRQGMTELVELVIEEKKSGIVTEAIESARLTSVRLAEGPRP